ncbi:lysophospholipase L1-like esterase [Belliella baltica DSM 15883]|uniref:Lysophospholipase L1-like esterase n=1 Tax=Belliella baltica (strain DSM 15883 / CIP 108006 / LMG 21964 / BA134) TaxID=866536 RepID=I3Z927_BELBD|nr:GDSL-type esterase/lipase family protein [Belliella baltica]AFL85745.1 lysophospholipase L1-like esterase [Belliella baltica DSM 15883]
MKVQCLLILILAVISFKINQAFAQKTKVACIGDSVTFGYGISERDSLSYPSQLQRMLGDFYEVGNFGHSGATLLQKGHNPYVQTAAYKNALTFRADIAIIHLGLNDTDPRNWPYYKGEFEVDYASLIADLKQANPDVRILIAELSPIFSGHPRFKSGTRDWHREIRNKIRKIAKDNEVELIDFFKPLHQHPDLFPDNLHPTAQGAEILASLVYSKLSNEAYVFQLGEIFQNGALLQRGERVSVFGRGIPGEEVVVRLGNSIGKDQVDVDGNWLIELGQVPTGGPFNLEANHAKETLKLDSIWVGDLWLAMGQSNMDWPLSLSNGGKSLEEISQENLFPRIYKYDPVGTMNDQAWDKMTLEAVQDLRFFEGQWLSGQKLKDASGLVYYFAKQLGSHLEIPIGIVQLSLGGAPMESFVSRESLEEDNLLVDILSGWKQSDFMMPWVRQRIKENLGNSYETLQRHPFEPAYLHEAGIKQLEGLVFKGLIWYQGESNTHNPELYSNLFQLFAEDMRGVFGESLPIYTVQLPRMSREEWPYFREIQAQLAQELPDVYLATTIDLGDSLDVHPRDKESLGKRLAALTLNYSYDMSFEDPSKIKVKEVYFEKDILNLVFNVNDALKVKSGLLVHGFELIGPKGLRKKVRAEISKNTVLIEVPKSFIPEAVWYGFETFPQTNLLSPAGNPIGPFRLPLNLN